MQASHGVNDVLALKDADCSVAMASGSEAASQMARGLPKLKCPWAMSNAER